MRGCLRRPCVIEQNICAEAKSCVIEGKCLIHVALSACTWLLKPTKAVSIIISGTLLSVLSILRVHLFASAFAVFVIIFDPDFQLNAMQWVINTGRRHCAYWIRTRHDEKHWVNEAEKKNFKWCARNPWSGLLFLCSEERWFGEFWFGRNLSAHDYWHLFCDCDVIRNNGWSCNNIRLCGTEYEYACFVFIAERESERARESFSLWPIWLSSSFCCAQLWFLIRTCCGTAYSIRLFCLYFFPPSPRTSVHRM